MDTIRVPGLNWTTFLVVGLSLTTIGGFPVGALRAAELRPIVLDPTINHTHWGISPVDLEFRFRAYTTSFDSDDDDNADGLPDRLGIPEWVAYQIDGLEENLGASPGRPSNWMTDSGLFAELVAPDDSSYRNSGYSRGHLCMKVAAFRLGNDADWKAAPQKLLKSEVVSCP